jgi:hypothetical protein
MKFVSVKIDIIYPSFINLAKCLLRAYFMSGFYPHSPPTYMLYMWAQKERQHIHPQEENETNMEAMETIFGYNMEAKDVMTKSW